jgi:hypothetical protein
MCGLAKAQGVRGGNVTTVRPIIEMPEGLATSQSDTRHRFM